MGGKAVLGRFLRKLIRAGRTRRAAEDDAQRLLAAYQGWAYREARRRAREARSERWREGDRHWSRVARAIARLEKREIGVKTADRYGS